MEFVLCLSVIFFLLKVSFSQVFNNTSDYTDLQKDVTKMCSEQDIINNNCTYQENSTLESNTTEINLVFNDINNNTIDSFRQSNSTVTSYSIEYENNSTDSETYSTDNLLTENSFKIDLFNSSRDFLSLTDEIISEENFTQFATSFIEKDITESPNYFELNTTLILDNNSNDTVTNYSKVMPKILTKYKEREDSNTTILDGLVEERTRGPRAYIPISQERVLLLLKSNCSLIDHEILELNELVTECMVYVRINYTAENNSNNNLLKNFNSVVVKSQEFEIVTSSEELDIHQIHEEKSKFSIDRETVAYLAVASAFAFVVLIAIIIFGVRCLKKRKPSFDMSRLDVKLSDYTLTRIPRVSLSSTECLHNPNYPGDRPKSSTLPKEKYGLLRSISEGKLDNFPHDRFQSTGELKTFKSSRYNCNPEDVHPESSNGFSQRTMAYENPTFQRYF